MTRRGHKITYFTTEGYQADVEAAGVKVHLCAAVLEASCCVIDVVARVELLCN